MYILPVLQCLDPRRIISERDHSVIKTATGSISAPISSALFLSWILADVIWPGRGSNSINWWSCFSRITSWCGAGVDLSWCMILSLNWTQTYRINWKQLSLKVNNICRFSGLIYECGHIPAPLMAVWHVPSVSADWLTFSHQKPPSERQKENVCVHERDGLGKRARV